MVWQIQNNYLCISNGGRKHSLYSHLRFTNHEIMHGRVSSTIFQILLQKPRGKNEHVWTDLNKSKQDQTCWWNGGQQGGLFMEPPLSKCKKRGTPDFFWLAILFYGTNKGKPLALQRERAQYIQTVSVLLLLCGSPLLV